MSILSERLKAARKKMKQTQTQVQLATGINAKTLGGYENEVSEPDLDTLTTLAVHYDVTIDWLTGNTNNPEGSLSSEERQAVEAINLNEDDSFLNIPMNIDGRELSAAEKQKVLVMARLLLQQDR